MEVQREMDRNDSDPEARQGRRHDLES